MANQLYLLLAVLELLGKEMLAAAHKTTLPEAAVVAQLKLVIVVREVVVVVTAINLALPEQQFTMLAVVVAQTILRVLAAVAQPIEAAAVLVVAVDQAWLLFLFQQLNIPALQLVHLP
jgi:hypothetical protein